MAHIYKTTYMIETPSGETTSFVRNFHSEETAQTEKLFAIGLVTTIGTVKSVEYTRIKNGKESKS